MKKLLFLLPALIGGAFLTGCVEETVVTRGPAPAYYGDPYYMYGGVQYYYVGGRYFYYRNNHRYYVNTLPPGGSYGHGHGNYHGNPNNPVHASKYNNVNVSRQNNVNVNRQNNVNVNKSVNQQNAVHPKPGPRQGPPPGKKYHKGDQNDTPPHP